MGRSLDPDPPSAGMFPAIFYEGFEKAGKTGVFGGGSGNCEGYPPRAPFDFFRLYFTIKLTPMKQREPS